MTDLVSMAMLKQHRNNDFSMLCNFASNFTETTIWAQGDIFGKEKTCKCEKVLQP